MILHRLTLKNFGLFCGVQTFSLTPRIKYRKWRPIVLIGGKNGTGKTTILEAVCLCLYSHLWLNNCVSGKPTLFNSQPIRIISFNEVILENIFAMPCHGILRGIMLNPFRQLDSFFSQFGEHPLCRFLLGQFP